MGSYTTPIEQPSIKAGLNQTLVELKSSSTEVSEVAEAKHKQTNENNKGNTTEIPAKSSTSSQEPKPIANANSADSSQNNKRNEEKENSQNGNLLLGGLSIAFVVAYIATYTKKDTGSGLRDSTSGVAAKVKVEQQKPLDIVEHPLVDQEVEKTRQESVDNDLRQSEAPVKVSQAQTESSSNDHEEISKEVKSDTNDSLTLDEEDVTDLSISDQGTSVNDEARDEIVAACPTDVSQSREFRAFTTCCLLVVIYKLYHADL